MRTKDIFEKIAKENHTTSREVYMEIQNAIDAGFENPDPKVQEEWKKIEIKGERPTPEEVIAYVVARLKNQ